MGLNIINCAHYIDGFQLSCFKLLWLHMPNSLDMSYSTDEVLFLVQLASLDDSETRLSTVLIISSLKDYEHAGCWRKRERYSSHAVLQNKKK